MIFYFSGTGNSKYVAKSMQDSNLINIGEAVRQGEYIYELDADEPVGMIMPVYYSGIPKTVIDFVRKLEIKGSISYFYCILTHGGGPGGAGSMLKKELDKKGYPFHACYDVEMASNYIMFGDLKPDEHLRNKLKAAKPKIDEIRKLVEIKDKALPEWSSLDVFLTSTMKPLCDKFMSTRKFHADEGCTGCGACAARCPSSLIKMVDGKPQWNENKCVRCMACLQCEHVQYGKATKNRRRYSFDKYNS